MTDIKPLENVNKIFSFCCHGIANRNAKKNDVLIIDDMVFFLFSGTASVRRADGLNMMSFAGPMVLGISDFIGSSHELSIIFHSSATFGLMPRKRVLEICHEHNAWFDVNCILSYILGLAYQKLEISEQKTKYETIKKFLYIINSLPEDERANTSVYEYIMSRSGMSRSALNKVLAGLRSGKYIEMHRGRLMRVNKLPPKF